MIKPLQLLAPALLLATPWLVQAETIGCATTAWKLIGANHKVCVEPAHPAAEYSHERAECSRLFQALNHRDFPDQRSATAFFATVIIALGNVAVSCLLTVYTKTLTPSSFDVDHDSAGELMLSMLKKREGVFGGKENPRPKIPWN